MRFILSAAVLVALSSTASASGWYSTVYGGWNQDDVISLKGVDSNSGYVVGGTIGKRLPASPDIRIEVDFSFRQNEVDLFGGFISADHDTTAALVNVAYDIPVEWRVKPYLLAGVGFGHTEATFEDISLAKLENSGVAYQLGAGFNIPVTHGVDAGIGYRYFQGPDINVLGAELSDGSNHSIVAHLTFSLD